MSNRQRGGKTLSAEDEIVADSVNIVGSGLAVDGFFGTAHQVLQKDSINSLEWKALTIADLSITGSQIANGTIENGKLANLTIEGGKIANGTIESDKLANDISIFTTGDLVANVSGTIASVNGNISISGTGNFSTNSGDISTTSGDIIIGASGELQTNTIDKVSGSAITIKETLSLATDKGINLLGTGGILTINGGVTCAGSGSITAASGDITAGSGKLKGNTIAKATGSNITIEDTISFASGKGIITDDGDILSSSGDITTATGKLKANTIAKASGSNITIENPIDCGSNNITTTGQVAAGTLSVSTFSPASLVISGSGDIQTTSGKVLANTIGKGSAAVSFISINENIVFATGKGVTTGTGIIETTSGNIICGGTLITDTIAKQSGSSISISDPLDCGSNSITTTGNIGGLNITGTGLITGESLTIHRDPLGGFHTIVIMSNLPTSAPSTTGQVWNNGGVLNIVS